MKRLPLLLRTVSSCLGEIKLILAAPEFEVREMLSNRLALFQRR